MDENKPVEELTIREVLSGISTDVRSDEDAWDIVTALRGPDVGRRVSKANRDKMFQLKALTTKRIRGILLLDSRSLAVERHELTELQVETRNKLLYWCPSTHFVNHFVSAIRVLSIWKYSVPQIELDFTRGLRKGQQIDHDNSPWR